MKDVVAQFSVFWLLLIRFGCASLIMLLVFHRRIVAQLNVRTLRTGALLGVLYGLAYVFQTFGIVYTTPGKNAFLTGVYCVLMPFFTWLLGRGKPRRMSVVAAVITLAGMGFVVLDKGFPLNSGDVLTLIGALLYALEMVVVSGEGRTQDVWALTFWQFVTMSLIMAVGAGVLEYPPSATVFTLGTIVSLVFLVVICSFATLAILNYALTHVNPSEGALLSSLESPSGAAFSVVFGYEILTPKLLVGFILIFCGIVCSEVGDRVLEALPQRNRTK